MTTKGFSSGSLPEVTPDEESEIREEYDEVVICHGQAKCGKALHLGTDDGGKVCGHTIRGGTRRKPFAVYPPGHRSICRECAEVWRRSR